MLIVPGEGSTLHPDADGPRRRAQEKGLPAVLSADKVMLSLILRFKLQDIGTYAVKKDQYRWKATVLRPHWDSNAGTPCG